MAVSLKHKFTNPKPDGSDPTIVRPSNWNDEHDLVMSSGAILGRTTAGVGSAEEITVGAGLQLSDGVLSSTVTVAPGGSDTQIQFNDGGAFAGNAGLTFNKTSKALTIASGTQTASNPALNITQTWNNAGVTFTGATINVENTASASSSLLFDARLGGVSKFGISLDGSLNFSSSINFNISGTSYARLVTNSFRLPYASAFGWTATGAASDAQDTFIYRDAANAVAQRNGVNAQTKRIYGTYTDASNYERGYLTTDTNGLTIGTEAAGTGVKRPVRVVGPSLAFAEAVSILDLSQTWNTTGTPTALKLNVTDTASNASSLLVDLQVGGSSKFSVNKSGNTSVGSILTLNNGYSGQLNLTARVGGGGGAWFNVTNFSIGTGATFSWSTNEGSTPDLLLTRRAAANLRLGAADAAAPVAQTLSVQSVVAGTTNTAGANLTITGSQGTGTGAGGSIIFQVAPAGTTGTAQNALVTALTITSANQLLMPISGSFGALIYGTGNSQGSMIGRNSTSGDQGVFLGSGARFGWTGGAPDSAVPDLYLVRDAANTLAQRNGVNAQTKRLYGTYTDASNYRRLAMTMSAAGVAEIKPEGGGTGASGNVLYISGLPTSNPGPGILWNNAGTPAIGT